MKPNELIVIDNKFYSRLILRLHGCPIRGYAKDHKVFEPYIDDDCVVAYYSGPMGVMLLIKGKIKFFAFTANVYGGHFERQPVKDIISALHTHGKVVDKKLWKQVCIEEMI